MRKSVIYSFILLIGMLVSCSGGTSEEVFKGLSADQREAALAVKKTLPRNEKITKCVVTEAVIPFGLDWEGMKQMRDALFKAGLDYNSCKTRGIQMGMDKAIATIDVLQSQIVEMNKEFTNANKGKELVFVLAAVESKKVNGNGKYYIFAGVDPSNKKVEFSGMVTSPLLNNIEMVVCALTGKLTEYAIDGKKEAADYALLTDNAALQMLLSVDPSLIR